MIHYKINATLEPEEASVEACNEIKTLRAAYRKLSDIAKELGRNISSIKPSVYGDGNYGTHVRIREGLWKDIESRAAALATVCRKLDEQQKQLPGVE